MLKRVVYTVMHSSTTKKFDIAMKVMADPYGINGGDEQGGSRKDHN